MPARETYSATEADPGANEVIVTRDGQPRHVCSGWAVRAFFQLVDAFGSLVRRARDPQSRQDLVDKVLFDPSWNTVEGVL